MLNKVYIVTTDKTLRNGEDYLSKTIESIKKSEYKIKPEVVVCKDWALGCRENHEEVMRRAIQKEEYIFKIEDDVLFSKGTMDAINYLIDFFHPPMITIYSNRTLVTNNIDKGYCWIPPRQWINEQGCVYRKDFVEKYLREAPTYKEYESRYQDGLMQEFVTRNNIKVLAICPSALQHTGVVSSLPRNKWIMLGLPRESRSFQGEDFNVYEHLKERL